MDVTDWGPGKGPRGYDPEGEARCQHYTFAHQALPGYVFRDPRRFFAIMNSEHAMELLQALWEDAGAFSKEQGRGYNHSFDDARLHRYDVGGGAYLTALEMPDAVEVPEAVYIGIVVRFGPEGGDGQPTCDARYFTLERSSKAFVDSGVMFCEWTAERRHVNHGAARDDQLDTFIGRVGAVMRGG